MLRFLVTALGATVLLGAYSPYALAGQPDPDQSSFGPLVAVSPKNLTVIAAHQYAYTVTLRDGAGIPIQGFPKEQVELDFIACTGQPTRPADQIQFNTDSNVNGQMEMRANLTFGGSCTGQVVVLVQNVSFEVLPMHQGLPNLQIDGGVRSPDINGLGGVALTDLVIFKNEFNNVGTRLDYIGDLNFNGLTDLPDLVRYAAHFNAP